jgi:signal recognition particle GTPase
MLSSRYSYYLQHMTDAHIICPQYMKSGEMCRLISCRVGSSHTSVGVIERLRHEGTSYKTRVSSYGDAHGCLEGTRVKILADLEAWAMDDDGCKVYWLVGMAGTGKSTISHTKCSIT